MRRPVLRRKLAIPAPWAEVVTRPRLNAHFDAALAAGRHLVVVASSGFGKTTALADWCRGRRAAWVTLDAEDTDLNAFLAYLLAAIEGLYPGFATAAASQLGIGQGPAQGLDRAAALAATDMLLADLDEQVVADGDADADADADSVAVADADAQAGVGRAGGPAVIVLDDYHLAESPSLDLVVERLLRYLPPELRLAISTRTMPDLPVAAGAAKGWIEPVAEDVLACETTEVAAFRPELSSAAREALRAATGGWPAGVMLPADRLEAYLADELLRDAGPTESAVLAQAALVDQFDAGMVAAVCVATPGDPAGLPAAGALQMLVARRLILPAEGGQFQVLPHLRGILERRVRDGLPSAERGAMYARAAAYLWERGQEASALSCWLQGGMATEAAMRLATVSDSWLAADRLDAINKVLAALPDALLDSLPAVPNAGGTVVLAGAELYLVAGEVERRWGNHPRALDRFERAAGLFAAGADASGQARVAVRQAQALAASARMAEARAKAAESRAKAAESRAKAAESRAKAAESRDRAALDASFEADLHNLEGALALLEERPDDASRAFAASLELARRLADPRAEARAAHNLGVCHTKTRDFHRALQAYDSALAGSDTTPALWMTPINRALVLVYLERFDAAEQAAEAALEAVRRLRLTREEGFALRALGLAYAGRRRLTAALDCFVAAEHLARRTHDPLGLAYSLNFQADVMADEGDPAGALARSDEALALLGATGEPERHPEFARVRAKALGALPTPATGSSLTLMQEEVSGMDLEIRCFGGLKVMRPDGPVGEGEWQSSRAKLLLAFLLHHPEGGSKVKLLDWLYPGQLKTDASLHMNIQRLRKALEPGLAKGQAPRFVRWSEGLYTFNRQAHVGVDTWRFDAALRAQSGGTDDEIRRLREALAEITGDFLPEFDTDWVVAMRQRYRDRALGACRRLIELLDQRDPAATLEAVQRALEIDPLAAEFHRELILRFLEAGERHRALEHFRVCERRFLETLGMAPPDDLRDLVT